MVNWQEAGKTWPQPYPYVVYLLRGFVWGQHYRHSNPECEGGMPGSFELREDMGDDRQPAVVDWLRVEGYAYRFRQKRWRVWTRPDRPGEGLRPDGTDEEENPNEYLSGATINVSIWDMIEKKFRDRGTRVRCRAATAARPLGRRSNPPGTRSGTRNGGSTRKPGCRSRPSCGERDQGRNPSPQPPTASGGYHPGHTTLGDFFEVAKKAKAKPRQLHLRKSGPSSDVESGHRGRMPADEASSSSSVAPDQRDVARACERACGVPCNFRVARQRATQQTAAGEGAVGIAQEEAADSGRGMAFRASTVAAIAAGVTAAAAQEAAAARVRS